MQNYQNNLFENALYNLISIINNPRLINDDDIAIQQLGNISLSDKDISNNLVKAGSGYSKEIIESLKSNGYISKNFGNKDYELNFKDLNNLIALDVIKVDDRFNLEIMKRAIDESKTNGGIVIDIRDRTKIVEILNEDKENKVYNYNKSTNEKLNFRNNVTDTKNIINEGIKKITNTAQKGFKSIATKIINVAKQYLNIPYKWGAKDGKKGFDCSGLTSAIYKKFGINIGEGTYAQSHNNPEVKDVIKHGNIDMSKLQPGDLIFFDMPGGRKGIDHVAIYLGDGKVCQASSSKGVIINNYSNWYKNKTVKVVRPLNNSKNKDKVINSDIRFKNNNNIITKKSKIVKNKERYSKNNIIENRTLNFEKQHNIIKKDDIKIR